MYRITPQGLLKDKLLYASDDGVIVISNARLVDGQGEAPKSQMTVVIEGERIEAIGPSDQIPAPEGLNVQQIDAEGKTLMPGLIDLHVHFTGDVYRDPFRRYMQPIEEERVIRGAIDAHAVLSAGFTTVRVLGHGTPNQAESLKRTINSQLIAGPRIFHAGWALSQTGGHGNLPIWPYDLVEQLRPRSAFADGVNGCRVAVRRNLGQGADLIKIYTTEGVITTPPHKQGIPNFTLAEIEAMTDEAHRRGATVAAHAMAAEGILNAVNGGVDTIEHGAPDPDGGWLERMAECGTILVPTLTVFAAAAENADGNLAPEVGERVKRWLEGNLRAVSRARELGTRIAVGTDDGRSPLAGKNAWELELLVTAGLSPMEAIVAATQTAAEALNLADQLGTIETGKIADLLVVDGNPDQNISCLRQPANISTIIKSGATLS
jgi:imidazolonepropionase-like amidohydrolase